MQKLEKPIVKETLSVLRTYKTDEEIAKMEAEFFQKCYEATDWALKREKEYKKTKIEWVKDKRGEANE